MKIPFFGKKEIQKKNSPVTYNIEPDSFLAYAFGRTGWISANQAAKLYRSTAAIATAVDMIAGCVKQINPVIRTPDGNYSSSDKVLDLLKKPNGFQDWEGFIETTVTNYLLKHDAIILASGNINMSPAEIWPESLQAISITQGIDQYPENYNVSDGVLTGIYSRTRSRSGEFRFYDGFLKELYHIRGYSSRMLKTESDSPIQAAAMEARQIIKGKYHNVKILENGGRLSLLIAFKDDDFIDAEEHEQRKQSLQEQYGGTGNAGAIGVISGADIQHIKEFGKSNKDMDYAKLDDMASRAIYMRYGIPLALVTSDAQTFNNMITGVELLYDNAVLPAANKCFSALSRMLLPRYKRDIRKEQITFNPESIEPLKKRKLEEVTKRNKIGIETINELRSLLPGREPIEGGDILFRRANMEPVGKDLDTSNNNPT